jgi:DNA-3-methyladenine glycosylase
VAFARQQLEAPAVQVAPLLLGATVRSELDGHPVTVRLTEVEAYEGPDDPASHAYRGRTPRTAVMFGPAGHLYCYFVYGMHWCANVVTGPDGHSSAVLLRAGEILDGEPVVRERSGATSGRPRTAAVLASGPARLARALGLNGSHTGLDLLDPASPVRLLELGSGAGHRTGPRVGVSVAADRPWRFWLEGEPSVSRYRPGGRKRVGTTRQTQQP